MNLNFTAIVKSRGCNEWTGNFQKLLTGFLKKTLLTCLFLGVTSSSSFASPTFASKAIHTLKSNIHFQIEQYSFEPCPGGSGNIGGTVFQDFNFNGENDQFGTGLEGITVIIFGCGTDGASQMMGTTTTDKDGNYFFSGLNDGEEYRVEFSTSPELDYLQSGFSGADSRTSVQFVTSPSCDVNYGMASPDDFCEEDPFLAIPCFVNGDPLAAGSGSADEDALVMFKTSYEGNSPKPTTLALAEEIGATWGIAYHRERKEIFTSAFLKRHVGLGPLGLGGIYKIDINGIRPEVTPWLDVTTIGINVGSFPSNSARGLSSNINQPSNDAQAFVDVGKKGLGGMCMSEDGEKLYVVNLSQKTLHSISMVDGTPTSADVQSFPIPDPGCSGGEFRPFAVRIHGGRPYVGGVCDAESSGNKSDLRAVVYRLDGSSFTEVLSFSLDYTKGLASRSCEDDRGWFPWTTELPEPCFLTGNNNVVVHPTPQLTAFEFDDNGNMILGFTDRMGNQLGYLNYPPSGTDLLYSAFTGGDILKAAKAENGNYEIENNGSVGGFTSAGAGNEEGPGGGEFYYTDYYEIAPGVPRPHSETAQGGLAMIKGSGQVITTALDPFSTSVNSGGVNYHDNQTGGVRDPGYIVFRSGSSSISSFSKANGLGDVVALCGEAPIEIGGRLWIDANENGVQDPCEIPLSGVNVALYNSNGMVMEEVTTNDTGEYFFNAESAAISKINPNTFYYIAIGSGGQASNGILLDSLNLTTSNTGMGSNPDLNDSDASIAGAGVLEGAFSGLPYIVVETGAPGSVTHDNDAGFFVSEIITGTIDGYVWFDENQNGLQNGNEQGLGGVTVNLYATNNTLISNTTTNPAGQYNFANLTSGDYYLTFDIATEPTLGTELQVTQPNAGSNDEIDSDIDASGRVDFSFEPEVNPTQSFDAGYVLPESTIGGFIFDDANQDGLQSSGEGGIGGVTVILYDGAGNELASTTSDGSGNYSFGEFPAGDYYVQVDITTVGENYEGTTQNAGDDNLDSDVNPATGESDIFTHNPSQGSTDIDAGFYEDLGTITGRVFLDANENGLQDAVEQGIGGVEVIVLAPDGTPISVNTSFSDGTFVVDGIPSGTVLVLFDPGNNSEQLENLTPTIKDVNNNQNDDIDSDVNNNRQSDPIEFSAPVGADVDAGFFMPVNPVTIGDFVFKDCNRNGIQDPGEKGVANVPVTLTGTNDLGEAVSMETTTNTMGGYSFMLPRPGRFSLDFDFPEGVAGLEFSPQNQGRNANLDSDVNPLSGATPAILLESGERILTVDAGIVDVAPPLIFNVPPDVTVDCNDIPSVPATVKGVDNCDPNVDVDFTERIIDEGACPYIIERTWSTQDECGNMASRTQRITVTDTTPPVITIANPILYDLPDGGEIILHCDELPEFSVDDVNVTDDCSEVEVEFVDLVREQGDCAEEGYLVKMICGWIAEDDCGNRSEFNFTILVVDTEAPMLQNVPDDVTINLDEGQFVPPVANTVTGTDNCDEYVTIEFEETRSTGVCGGEIIRTWTGYDDCGNKVVESQKVTLLENCSCPTSLVGQTLVWDATCDGSAGGMIIMDLTADINRYDISISPNIGNSSFINNRFTDLPPGDYVVTVKYESTEVCEEVLHFTVGTADIGTVTIDKQTDADCFTSNGSVTLLPANYLYEWSDGVIGNERNDLAAGTYQVTFTDENQCKGTVTVNIGNSENCDCVNFDLSLGTATMPTCPAFTNGQVEVIVSGGTAPYTYLWHDGQTSAILYSASEGAYSVTVTDAAGCSATLDGSLSTPPPLNLQETLMNGICGEKGAIDLFVSGGTPPYQYLWNTGATTEDLSNLTTGSYTVTVTDANRCEATLTIPISNGGDISVNLTPTHPGCSGDATGAITATVTGGTFPLTYEWSNGASSSVLENLEAGTYAVMVTDADGCKAMAEVTLTSPSDLRISGETIVPECGGEGKGQINLQVSGGTGNYNFAWSNGAITQNISNLESSSYTVTVSDASGCSATANFNIQLPSPLAAQVTTNNPACFGENGSISVTMSGGVSPYTYQWNNGSTSPDQNDLPIGDYSVTITDANGCVLVENATLAAPPDLAINGTTTPPACSGEPTGAISLTVSGGTAPYTYSWSTGSADKDLSALMPGGYSVVVRDANGCESMETFNLTAPDGLDASVETTQPDCSNGSGAINLTVSGGTAPYAYNWSNGAITKDLSGLSSDTYTVTITDANGCQSVQSATITVPEQLEVVLSPVAPSCNGEMGAINLTVSGGTAPYAYSWSNGTTSKDLQNIPAGNYGVTVTDANGCQMTSNTNLEAPGTLVVSGITTPPACSGEPTGAISLTVSGGTAPYTYSWSTGSADKDLTALMPGGYSVVVRDANGCEKMETFNLTAPSGILAEADISQPKCHDGSGDVSLSISGGTPPYSFNWSNGATTKDVSGLVPDTYAVTITDQNNCSFTTAVEVTAPSPISASANVTNQDCSSEGNIDLSVTGGTPPYTYLWSNGSTSEDLSTVGGGLFTVVITDAANCKFTYEVNVTSVGGIEVFVSGNAPTCPGGTDGSLTLEVSGGTLPYSYQWSNGSGAAGLSNIAAGAYQVTVTDAKGCTLEAPAVLDATPPVSLEATVTEPSCGDGTGQISVVASGGNGGFTYLWNTGETSSTLANLPAGAYSLTVTDAEGCQEFLTRNIQVPDDLEIQLNVVNPVCGGNTGDITTTIAGGTMPYSYSWNNGATSSSLEGVESGTYTLTVTDANGCFVSSSADIISIDGLTVDIESTQNPSCDDGNDGAINLNISGGTPPYNFNWTNGANTEDIANLTAGFYAVTITDAQDCQIVLDALLEAPAPISISSMVTTPDCPGETGAIDVTITGGTPPYQYLWTNGEDAEDISGLTPGNYQLMVVDAAGCSISSENIVIASPVEFNISFEKTDISCFGATDGAIDLTIIPAGAYTYQWSNGATGEDLSGLAPGSYMVTVVDQNDCSKSQEIIIDNVEALNVDLTMTHPQCPGETGGVNVNVSGGTAPYTYLWNTGSTQAGIADVQPGTYTVQVTDAKSCTIEAIANIRQVSDFTATESVTPETCVVNDGAIQITVAGGIAPYTYLWNTGATSKDLSGLTSGTYSVTVQDFNGCEIIKDVVVENICGCPDELVMMNMVTNSRCGEANGSIMIMVNGDLEHYQFEWSPDIGTPGAFNNERNNLPAGQYTIVLSYGGQEDCTQTVRLSISNKDGETGAVESVESSDCGLNNGRVVLRDGVTYIWPDGSQSKDRDGLAPGEYVLRVLDGGGCESSLTVTVQEKTCEVTCDLVVQFEDSKVPDCDSNNGSIELGVTGGTPPYNYQWGIDGVGNTNVATGLSAGEYTVTITDANNCQINAMITLPEPDCSSPITCNLSLYLESKDISCNGASDGQINLTVTGGAGNYVFEWNNGDTTQNLTDLPPGEYSVLVTDQNSCRVSGTIRVREPNELVVTSTQNIVDCEKLEIRLNVSGGRAPFTWECEDESGSLLDPLQVSPGTYICTITDGAGCSTTHTLVVEDYQQLGYSATLTHASCGAFNGSIELTPNGGTPPYNVSWSNGANTEGLSDLAPGDYIVTISDALDCTVSDTFSIKDCNGLGFGFVNLRAELIEQQQVQLDWKTRNEQTKGFFVVLQSTDGENYTEVGAVVNGAGPIDSALYTTQVPVSLGLNFFRIRYLDEDLQEYFSPILELQVDLAATTSRSIPAIIYPNPTHDEFTLDFARPIEEKVNVLITDTNGEILQQLDLEPGTTKKVFQTINYDAGVYNITLQQRRKRLVTYRLVKSVR